MILYAAVALGCREDGDQPVSKRRTTASDPALILDGVVITRGEIESYTEYFLDLDPTMGRNNRLRNLLDQHLIPMAFARRDFAVEREARREQAESLARALGTSSGYDDMLERTRNHPDAESQTGVRRQHLPYPEQRWLFDDETVGQVSPVLESRQGFSLVAAADKTPGLTKAFDKVDALLLRFYTHRSKEYAQWWSAQKNRLQALDKAAKRVHDDYRDALPRWLECTRLPADARLDGGQK